MGGKAKDNNWCLVYCKSRQEGRVIEHLERQGFRTFFPKFQNKKHVRGVWKRVIEPLFPSYLFVYLSEMSCNWLPIHSTYGVSKIVKFGEKPAMVSKNLINQIRDKVVEKERAVFEPVFKSGQKVEVVEGVMAGLDAIFQCYSSRDRVAILINLLGQQSKVDLQSNHIIPII